jgi:hypothetical protein
VGFESFQGYGFGKKGWLGHLLKGILWNRKARSLTRPRLSGYHHQKLAGLPYLVGIMDEDPTGLATGVLYIWFILS